MGTASQRSGTLPALFALRSFFLSLVFLIIFLAVRPVANTARQGLSPFRRDQKFIPGPISPKRVW